MKKVAILLIVLSLLFASVLPALAFEVVPVPEPSTIALLVAGIIGLAGFWKIRK